MGIENNECVIATTWSSKVIEKSKIWISTLPTHQSNLFVFVPSMVNSKTTIFLGPDGSKKGWADEKTGDELRSSFINYLKSFDYEDGSNPFDYVEVGYGEFGQKVLQGNCKNRYSDLDYEEKA